MFISVSLFVFKLVVIGLCQGLRILELVHGSFVISREQARTLLIEFVDRPVPKTIDIFVCEMNI